MHIQDFDPCKFINIIIAFDSNHYLNFLERSIYANITELKIIIIHVHVLCVCLYMTNSGLVVYKINQR